MPVCLVNKCSSVSVYVCPPRDHLVHAPVFRWTWQSKSHFEDETIETQRVKRLVYSPESMKEAWEIELWSQFFHSSSTPFIFHFKIILRLFLVCFPLPIHPPTVASLGAHSVYVHAAGAHLVYVRQVMHAAGAHSVYVQTHLGVLLLSRMH